MRQLSMRQKKLSQKKLSQNTFYKNATKKTILLKIVALQLETLFYLYLSPEERGPPINIRAHLRFIFPQAICAHLRATLNSNKIRAHLRFTIPQAICAHLRETSSSQTKSALICALQSLKLSA
jgi:hypothetical protein